MAQFNFSAGKIAQVSKADAELPGGRCYAILCGTAGTANVMDADGNILSGIPLQVGYNPISLRQVRTGGTATDLWALYERP